MHKVGINGIIDIFESANNAKNVKNATVFFDGNSGMNGVTGERIKEQVALVILVILADGWYKDVL